MLVTRSSKNEKYSLSEPSGPRLWENAIDELQGDIRNIHDMEDKVYRCLKFSYDHLTEKDQNCFLYCALYPEDHEIKKHEIIEYWMEEGLTDEMGSRKAMGRSVYPTPFLVWRNSLHCCSTDVVTRELESLPCVVKLQALRKLDPRSSGGREIPQGLGMLVNLRHLDLGYTRRLKEIATGLLLKLCRLQHLAIHSILKNAEEMSELNKLEAFEGVFSNIGYLNMYAGQRKELYKYSILVCPLNKPRSFVQHSLSSSSRNSVRFESIDINSGVAIVPPYQLQQLHLNYCRGVTSLNNVGLRDGIDLKVCELVRCDELESVFSSKCDQLRTLEYLTLEQLRL
ncbi:hypothetical protein F3Y22_tig00111146pilonHSYRG00033 [Hibiscus syriacus]|uniref:Uncharacterized protein n=1 Tax=Hibiscus syriacus TaxID=106335 RepID=A0A6A2YZD9_HIBSY|nr:uncharacterized protein LOC120154680 [Hibiscus syriacus]KAE8684275.1 hypothetical protein F3Y22_tig00111146pilonHSYRG00033 [Hibiscus syriacus]